MIKVCRQLHLLQNLSCLPTFTSPSAFEAYKVLLGQGTLTYALQTTVTEVKVELMRKLWMVRLPDSIVLPLLTFSTNPGKMCEI